MYEKMWKNMVEPHKLLMTICCMRFACHEVYRHKREICNTSCYYTATMVTRKCLNIMLYVRYLSSLFCVLTFITYFTI